jgi:hypothetical protein
MAWWVHFRSPLGDPREEMRKSNDLGGLDGSDVPRDAMPAQNEVGTDSKWRTGEQPPGAAAEFSCRSGPGSGLDTEAGDGCVAPVLDQSAGNTPMYRRSLFRR